MAGAVRYGGCACCVCTLACWIRSSCAVMQTLPFAAAGWSMVPCHKAGCRRGSACKLRLSRPAPWLLQAEALSNATKQERERRRLQAEVEQQQAAAQQAQSDKEQTVQDLRQALRKLQQEHDLQKVTIVLSNAEGRCGCKGLPQAAAGARPAADGHARGCAEHF